MKSNLLFFVFAISAFCSVAQENISWSGSYNEKTSKTVLTATLEEGWHLYSQFVDENAGPVSTKFELAKNDNLVVETPMMEPEPIVAYDPNFEADVKYFEKEVSFEQEVNSKISTEAVYTVTYMICNAEMCLPPVDKEIKIMITK